MTWIPISPSAAKSSELPAGQRLECGKPPETYQCYNLNETKLLLQLDAHQTACQTQLKLSLDQYTEQTHAIAALNESLKLQKQATDEFKQESQRLFDEWVVANKRIQVLESKPSTSWIAWGMLGGFVLTTAILGGILIVK